MLRQTLNASSHWWQRRSSKMEGMGWIPAILMVTFLVKKTRLEPFFSVIYKLYISIFDACLTGRGPTMMGAETQFFAAQSAVWSWRHGECWRCFYQANFNPLGSSSESSHCFAQWTQWNHLGLALWHGCWPQNSCTTFPGAMLPEACFK